MRSSMSIEHVLAVLPVCEIAAANAFYEQLFGRPADNNPMPVLVEWQLLPHAWLQVTVDTQRAGSGQFNLAVDDLAGHLSELQQRGMTVGEIQPVNKGVELSSLTDPDGNTITLIGNFRVEY
jgi:predicted enzyme related to lactoylglutathione lyase